MSSTDAFVNFFVRSVIENKPVSDSNQLRNDFFRSSEFWNDKKEKSSVSEPSSQLDSKKKPSSPIPKPISPALKTNSQSEGANLKTLIKDHSNFSSSKLTMRLKNVIYLTKGLPKVLPLGQYLNYHDYSNSTLDQLFNKMANLSTQYHHCTLQTGLIKNVVFETYFLIRIVKSEDFPTLTLNSIFSNSPKTEFDFTIHILAKHIDETIVRTDSKTLHACKNTRLGKCDSLFLKEHEILANGKCVKCNTKTFSRRQRKIDQSQVKSTQSQVKSTQSSKESESESDQHDYVSKFIDLISRNVPTNSTIKLVNVTKTIQVSVCRIDNILLTSTFYTEYDIKQTVAQVLSKNQNNQNSKSYSEIKVVAVDVKDNRGLSQIDRDSTINYFTMNQNEAQERTLQQLIEYFEISHFNQKLIIFVE